MNDLLGTLGLGNVAADPNDIPDGAYDGKITSSKYVLVKSKDQIAHVVNCTVTEGEKAGATNAKFNTLGDAPRDANGNFPDKVEDIVAYQPTMSDAQKTWYKKMWVDCGVPESVIDGGQAKPEMLEEKPVSFGIKTNNGFKNVTWIRLREQTAPAVNQAGGPFNAGVPSF